MEQDDPYDREGGEQSLAGEARPPIDWEQIEHDYIHGDWSIRRIAEARGSSGTTIGKRAKKEGWVRLVGTKRLPTGPKPRLPGAPRPKPMTPDQRRRRQMLKRLFEVLDGKMRQIEERMAQAESADGAGQSPAEAERDMRTLSSLARLYAKLVELDEAAKPPASKDGQVSDNDTATRSEDADRLRHDLALRLERLNRAGDA